MIPVEKYRGLYLDFYKSMAFDAPKMKDIWNAIDILKCQELDYILDVQKIWEATGARIPWQVIAAIDLREGGGRRARHLANGDGLHDRTFHVPAGLLKDVEPPYTFVQAAIGALQDFELRWDVKLSLLVWDVPTALCFCEAWNGFGYRRVLANPFGSPYLWNFTNHYARGNFDSDGHWNPDKICNEVGVAPILQILGLN